MLPVFTFPQKGVGPSGPEASMLEFVIILLPGVLIALCAQRLMRCPLDRHALLFLLVLNILVLNLAALVLRNFIMDFLSTDSYALATGTLAYSQGLLHQLLYQLLAGIPLCLLEAYLGRYISVRLDDTKSPSLPDEPR